jgi:hypothetical protein
MMSDWPYSYEPDECTPINLQHFPHLILAVHPQSCLTGLCLHGQTYYLLFTTAHSNAPPRVGVVFPMAPLSASAVSVNVFTRQAPKGIS